MQPDGTSEQRMWLGHQYLEILRRAARRDISGAGEFFGVPQGQIGYVLAGFQKQAIEIVCKAGLPYHVSGLARMLDQHVCQRAKLRARIRSARRVARTIE